MNPITIIIALLVKNPIHVDYFDLLICIWLLFDMTDIWFGQKWKNWNENTRKRIIWYI